MKRGAVLGFLALICVCAVIGCGMGPEDAVVHGEQIARNFIHDSTVMSPGRLESKYRLYSDLARLGGVFGDYDIRLWNWAVWGESSGVLWVVYEVIPGPPKKAGRKPILFELYFSSPYTHEEITDRNNWALSWHRKGAFTLPQTLIREIHTVPNRPEEAFKLIDMNPSTVWRSRAKPGISLMVRFQKKVRFNKISLGDYGGVWILKVKHENGSELIDSDREKRGDAIFATGEVKTQWVQIEVAKFDPRMKDHDFEISELTFIY